MSTTDIVLISTFGGIGYLLVGFVVAAVGGALFPSPTSFPRKKQIGAGWAWAVPTWPVVLAFGVLAGVLAGITLGTWPAIRWLTVRIARRLNPDIEGWEDW